MNQRFTVSNPYCKSRRAQTASEVDFNYELDDVSQSKIFVDSLEIKAVRSHPLQFFTESQVEPIPIETNPRPLRHSGLKLFFKTNLQ